MLSAESTMATLIEKYPGAQRALFRKYHIGGCSSCAYQPNETVAQVCARNGAIDPAELLMFVEQSHAEDATMLVEPTELKRALDSGATVRIVDIRTREEHDAVSIPKSEFFTEQLHQEILAKWPRTALIVFYDHQGKRSLDAAAYFLGHGFTEARALRGGIDAWSREVDPKLPRYKLD